MRVSYDVSGNADPGTRVLWPLPDYSYSLHATDPAPVLVINARIENIPPEGTHFTYSTGSGSLIEAVTAQYSPLTSDSKDAHFTLQLTAPLALTQGLYSDSVTISICFDAGCTRKLSTGTFTAHVTYHMQATEGADYTLRSFGVIAADVQWNAGTQKLEFIAYGASAVVPLSLAELDPTGNTLGRSVVLHANPWQLVVSDDCQYSYVLETDQQSDWWLERVRSSDFTIDQTWPLGYNFSGYFSMVAVPGEPHALLLQKFDSAGNTLSVLDDGVPRADSLDQGSYVGADSRAYFWSGSGSLLYAYQPSTSALLTIPVSTAGLGPDAPFASVMLVDTSRANGFGVVYAGGLIYGVDGHVFDPVAKSPLSPFSVDTVPYKGEVAVDAAVGRAYFLLNSGSAAIIESFAIAGRDRYWRIQLPVTVSNPSRMTRFGSDGLALLTPDAILLLNGAIIAN